MKYTSETEMTIHTLSEESRSNEIVATQTGQCDILPDPIFKYSTPTKGVVNQFLLELISLSEHLSYF